ncbi:P-loop containing nucleoside triphosphatehydrolases superfamily protein [Striga asiatica]|uniref:P-loop containing nucleoside triphosphatehydrolases superfamily protein n=1 Tax=Striga asiatica TaxID=4170 RepID=A0A5A7P9E8_STRAF|nr:P-loop containing nucleoside triphosphatehydrolases superfamily protein [Striga asiatica]
MTSLPSHPPTACGHHHEQAPPKAPQIQQLSSTHNPFLSTTDPANPRGRKWLLVAPRNQMTCCPALRQVVGAQLHHRLALNRGGSNRFGSIQRVMTTNKWLKILRTLLSKEKAENLDFKEITTMTEGYSRSDLKLTVREFLQHERQRQRDKV